MEWVLRSPQVHSTFGSLGFAHDDGYNINESCNAALETILHNILTEDKTLRTYRRNISFGQNIHKDLIPLLIHTKEDKTIELLIRILVNLTIPIECLLSVEVISKTDFGRHTVFEINNLLTSTKAAFADVRVSKVVIEFLKKNADGEQGNSKGKLSPEQCTNISNTLLLLRNILHIPEETNNPSSNSAHTVQNQILWNMFSQSIDKILIKLMTIPEATNWGVTMVQLIALLYKDQHVVTLHKLLNMWLEASVSESSEDNESNTSPPDRDSSPMLTSDPTSDSSDTGGSGKSGSDGPNSTNDGWNGASASGDNALENGHDIFQTPAPSEKETKILEKNETIENNDVIMKSDSPKSPSCSSGINSDKGQSQTSTSEKKTVKSETSDCGYGTQIENHESISTSSNEDEIPSKKPVHQKPHNAKQRPNNKVRSGITLQERKRKKITKRGKANIINVQGLSHKTPTDDDISNVLKEFTVDFLLRGYNSLVQTLHSQILTNLQLEIDTSHFFWLVTYFLKFATQIEMDLEHVCSVLSFDIVSYLTAEGVNLCEHFEVAIKLDGNDLKPSIRRLHLVVTAIREFVQAIEVYKKFPHLCNEHREVLVKLQMKMCNTEELRSLLVLLLRHYNPKYHTKQYLQDIVVTNHILLMFLDSVMKFPDYKGSAKMPDHIKQFATPEVMYQYGLLLDDYLINGEFVNDCIFTMMHHVGGELGCLIALFQPKILKTFTSIWKSEFEICDDWSDLIEYVINTFIKKPHSLQSTSTFRLDPESFDDDKILYPETRDTGQTKNDDNKVINSKDKWTDDEISSLSWNYMQCNSQPDFVGKIVKLFKEDSILKSRDSVICELLKQNLIGKEEFDAFTKGESDKKSIHVNTETRDDEIGKLCEQLMSDGKTRCLEWVQKVLLETCYAKIYLKKKGLSESKSPEMEAKIMNFELFKRKPNELPVFSPVSYHSLIFNQSVPLIAWNCDQAAICKDLKFLQLLHKLGFHMPVDTGKVFIRIPHFWTADFIYEVAEKILSIDTSKLNFSIEDISDSHLPSASQHINKLSPEFTKDITMTVAPENYYQIHKQNNVATMVNFTPMPGNSFNSEEGESNKPSWLDVVKKSHECKLNFHIGCSTIKEEEELLPPDIVERVCTDAGCLPVVPLVPVPLALSTVTSAPQVSTHIVHAEPDCNISQCDTASVASDLTRMYVSDEDEKHEVVPVVRPGLDIAVKIPPLKVPDDSDMPAGKRPRVAF